MILNLNFVRPGGSCQGSLPSQASFIDTRTRTRIRLKYRRVFNSVNMLPIRSTPSLPPDPPPLVSPSPPSPRSLSPSTHSHPASSPIGPSHMATPQRDLSAQRAALQASLAARTLHWSISASKRAKRGSWTVHKEKGQRVLRTNPKEDILAQTPNLCCYNCSLLLLSMNEWNKGSWVNKWGFQYDIFYSLEIKLDIHRHTYDEVFTVDPYFGVTFLTGQENHPTFSTYSQFWPWRGLGWVPKMVKPWFGMGQGNVWWIWWGFGHYWPRN